MLVAIERKKLLVKYTIGTIVEVTSLSRLEGLGLAHRVGLGSVHFPIKRRDSRQKPPPHSFPGAQGQAWAIPAGTTSPGRRCARWPMRRRAPPASACPLTAAPAPVPGRSHRRVGGRVPLKRETAAVRARWALVLPPLSGPAREAGEAQAQSG